jgi:hypothetical protein
MATEKIVFEGFYDDESGWEFEMPYFVLTPYRAAWQPTGSAYGLEQDVVEDYMIDMACGFPWVSAASSRSDVDNANWPEIERAFNAAKRAHETGTKLNGKYGGVHYFRFVVEYDPERIRDKIEIGDKVNWTVMESVI